MRLASENLIFVTRDVVRRSRRSRRDGDPAVCVSCSVSLSSQFCSKRYQKITICWAGFLTFKKNINSLVLPLYPGEAAQLCVIE